MEVNRGWCLTSSCQSVCTPLQVFLLLLCFGHWTLKFSTTQQSAERRLASQSAAYGLLYLLCQQSLPKMMLLTEGLPLGESCLIEPDVCSANCCNLVKHFLASVCSHLGVLSLLCWGTHTGSSVALSSWHTFTKLSSSVVTSSHLHSVIVGPEGQPIQVGYQSMSLYPSLAIQSEHAPGVGSEELGHAQVKLREKVTDSSLLLLEPCLLLLFPFLCL